MTGFARPRVRAPTDGVPHYYRRNLMKVVRSRGAGRGKALTTVPGWARRARAAVRSEGGRGEVATRVGARARLRRPREAGDEEVVLDGPVPVRERRPPARPGDR